MDNEVDTDTPAAVPEESTTIENENGIDTEIADIDSDIEEPIEEPVEDNIIEEVPIEEENVEEEIAISEEEMAELEEDYIALMEYVQENDIPVDVSFEDYTASYKDDGYDSPEEYVDAYYDMLISEDNVASASISGSNKWYYDTGTSLPQSANYSTYNLLSVAQKGDIVYEAKGGYTFTGHIAIVEGRYYSASKKQFYLRLIEAVKPANTDGYVCRGVLDDERVADKGVSIYRVSSATNAQKNAAVAFCISQLKKSYNADVPAKDYSKNESDWYCSELVWAAYYNQGINIETTNTPNEPGVTPRDISINSDKVSCQSIGGNRPENVLQDIGGHWAYSYIKYVVRNGLMGGVSTTTFAPNTAAFRAMTATVLYRLQNSPNAGSNSFTDVGSGQWFSDPVSWCSNNGLVTGYANGQFRPNEAITRQQFATILYRYAGVYGHSTSFSSSSLNRFSDRSSISSYALNAMRWAVSQGIMDGAGNGLISPTGQLTRAQMATMLKRFMENTAQ